MNERIKELAAQAGMNHTNRRSDGMYVVGEDVFEKFANLVAEETAANALQVINYIATDYVELSHDKVLWQRNDYIKKCRAVLDEHYGTNQ